MRKMSVAVTRKTRVTKQSQAHAPDRPQCFYFSSSHITVVLPTSIDIALMRLDGRRYCCHCPCDALAASTH